MIETGGTICDTRAMISLLKNSLQVIEDCNKPTLGYLADATSW